MQDILKKKQWKILNYWFDRENEEVFSGIRSEIKTLNVGKKLFYEKNYARIGVNTNDNLPLNKQLKFATPAIIIRCVLQRDEKLYQQVYLDECLYELCVWETLVTKQHINARIPQNRYFRRNGY